MMTTTRRPAILVSDTDGSCLAMVRAAFSGNAIGQVVPRFCEEPVRLETMFLLATSHFGSIGIVHLRRNENRERLIQVIEMTFQQACSGKQSAFFAVGTGTRELEIELLTAGFSLTVSSYSELFRIARAASRYWKSLDWPEQSLERRVLGSLPWSTIRQDGFVADNSQANMDFSLKRDDR